MKKIYTALLLLPVLFVAGCVSQQTGITNQTNSSNGSGLPVQPIQTSKTANSTNAANTIKLDVAFSPSNVTVNSNETINVTAPANSNITNATVTIYKPDGTVDATLQLNMTAPDTFATQVVWIPAQPGMYTYVFNSIDMNSNTAVFYGDVSVASAVSQGNTTVTNMTATIGNNGSSGVGTGASSPSTGGSGPAY